jgi:PEP-CTERM motif
MKKLILSAIVAAGIASGVYAQGTVAFQNAVGGVAGRVYSGTTNTLFASGAISLELFYGPVGSTTAAILALNNGTVFSTSIAANGVFFDGTAVTTTGGTGTGSSDANNNVGLVVTAWTGGAANYAAAVAAAAPHGFTAEFDNPTGGAGVPPATQANLVNWLLANPLVVVTPEPGTMVLGGLGAAALLLFRRRK